MVSDAQFFGRLIERFESLGKHEKAILKLVIEKAVSRMEVGRRTYGEWLPGDKRSFAREAMEEVVDAMHYLAHVEVTS